MDIALKLMIALTYTVVGLISVYIVRVTTNTAPLGVRVPAHQAGHPAITRQLRSYTQNGIIIAVLFGLVAYIAGTSMWISLALPFAEIVAILWNYAHNRRPIMQAKVTEQWFDGVDTRLTGRVTREEKEEIDQLLPHPRIAWFVYILSLLVLIPAVVAVVVHWQEIPESVPTHWGSSFEPDSWSHKSIGVVFMPTWIALGMIAVMAVTSELMIRVEAFPRSSQGQVAELRQRASQIYGSLGVAWFTLVLSVGFSFIQYAMYVPGAEHLHKLSFVSMLLGAAVGAVCMVAYQVSKIQTFVDELRTQGVTDDSELPDNDRFYKWGLFYYNPDDPAVLVDRRMGIGVGFNYARWQGKVSLFFMAALCIVPIALAFAL